MISRKEHYDYLLDMVKLKIWFIFHFRNVFSGDSFANFVNTRTMLLAYTSLNLNNLYSDTKSSDPCLWDEILSELESYISNSVNFDDFEAFSLKLIKPYLEPRVDKDMEGLEWMCTDPKYKLMNPFKYNLGVEGNKLEFHFENHHYPKSILGNKECMMSALEVMVNDAKNNNFKYIEGTTWLNNFKPWLRVFPPQWQANGSLDSHDIKGNLGFWGQFISSNLTLNKKVSDRFKRNKLLPYPMKTCFAHVDDFSRFLEMER
ncbi:hypothetical protein [Pseudoalteromonas umbrosa]|uniref:hypothetical protein n=1 Tax=Pseudoalteromonas umbrosa TaxID=3048489 RepID=UPI0024C27E7A|nr:hypothetical protein [Pseudoalteromonas sp. B95]MDK1288215.1 hypothetical protein [Pseudoalteromonas sp. B95]